MDIIELDLTDSAILEERYAAMRVTVAHDVPDFPEVDRGNCIDGLRYPWPANREEHWVAVVDGRIVGGFDLSMPTLDNLENAELEIWVLPECRRRGIGRALHARAVERARANGRKRLMGHCVVTLEGTGVVRDVAGSEFARAMGARWALDEVRRRWNVGTVSDADLAAQLAEAWTHAGGYEVATWRETVPEQLVTDMAYLDGRLVKDIPMGELAWEPEKVDVARVRAGEAAAAARKRRRFATGVVHTGTGRLVACTAIALDHGNDWHGWQHITIVDPDHRGHRLGTIVKLENLAFARSMLPELRTIDTWNAAENKHMIAINEAMGFRPVETWANWQQEL